MSRLIRHADGGQEDGPQGMPSTGGGGLVRVPNLRVCNHPHVGVAHAGGEKGELTSCVAPSSRRGKNLQLVAKEEEPGCPRG